MGFSKLTVRDVPLDNQTVLVRTDFNVPLDENGEIGNDFRIRASLPTIKYLAKRNCRIVIISHLGRPDGREALFSLEKVAKRLGDLLEYEVRFVDEAIGDKAYQAVKRTPLGGVILLENLRFYEGEETNDEAFADKLASASKAKYFVQDGFGAIHRAHASTDAITLRLPSVAGLLVEKEVNAIERLTASPIRPLLAILGGAKTEDKLPVLKKLVQLADRVVLGGAIANTFLSHEGVRMGESRLEPSMGADIDTINELAGPDKIVLPVDLAVGRSSADKRRVVNLGEVGMEDMALDVGDRTIEAMVKEVAEAKTVFWNGTLGVAEQPDFAHGSARLALALASSKDKTTVIGGGDTADFVLGWEGQGGKSFDHVSTGGGAFLELLAGNKLPGLEGLLDARK